MKSRGAFTLDEILSQAGGWRDAWEVVARHCQTLGAMASANLQHRVLFTGCGSTYYLAVAAAAHLRALTGWCVLAAPASELWFAPSAYIRPDDTMVAISRSGMTTETLRAVEAFEAIAHRPPITIQCSSEAPLALRGGLSIVTARAAERSVVQTRSFTSMLVAAMAINALLARRRDLQVAFEGLPAAGERVLESARGPAHEWGARLDIDRLYFLGSGARYGLACEASLKMKEMALTHTEPFHFLEFRHGPKSMVTATTLVIGLVSDAASDAEVRVLHEAAALGASVFVLGEEVEPVEDGPAVSFASRVPPEIRDVLYLPPLQLLACERALAKGLDPDRPRYLDAVVVVD
jgi:glucosamine--fructose-6-phosphate aminotransferase (isomerizing)